MGKKSDDLGHVRFDGRPVLLHRHLDHVMQAALIGAAALGEAMHVECQGGQFLGRSLRPVGDLAGNFFGFIEKAPADCLINGAL